MKFQLAINMERVTPELRMEDVERHTLEMVQMADESGFAIAWAAGAPRPGDDHRAQSVPDSDLVGRPHEPHPAGIRGGRRGLLAPDQGRGGGGAARPVQSRTAGVRNRLRRLSARVRPDAPRSCPWRRPPVRARDAAGGEGAVAGATASTAATSGPSRPRPRCRSPCSSLILRSGLRRDLRIPTTLRCATSATSSRGR